MAAGAIAARAYEMAARTAFAVLERNVLPDAVTRQRGPCLQCWSATSCRTRSPQLLVAGPSHGSIQGTPPAPSSPAARPRSPVPAINVAPVIQPDLTFFFLFVVVAAPTDERGQLGPLDHQLRRARLEQQRRPHRRPARSASELGRPARFPPML
jgi:hypothetical protein